MSKYEIEEYPQDQYRFRLYDNARKLDWPAIQKEQGADCVAVINLAYFALTAIPAKGIKAFDYQSAVMAGGEWLHKPIWHEYGICIDANGRMTLGTENQATYDYAVGCPPVDINGRRYTNKDGGKNGWTYTGIKADGTVVALICPKDTPMTTDALENVMRQAGCVTIFRWDGSWSSRGTLGPGKSVTPSQYRCCRSWLLVFRRQDGGTRPDSDKEDKPMKKIVCLDPGHGPGCVNGSPDGTYKEYEFTWDMSQRVKGHLERCGVTVLMTKSKDGYPSLSTRCDISNKANTDLFVSLHSNASGNGWMAPHGLVIYTSVAGATAGRNIAANKVLAQMRTAGVATLGGGLQHNPSYAVLRGTKAPAMIMEYGFHTNKGDVELLKDNAHRDKLALATAQGVCDYLGIKWVDDSKPNYRAVTQKRFGFAESTMAHLEAYEYADALFERLATGK